MAFFFYEIDEKIFIDANYAHLDDPSTKGAKGVNLVISQQYVALRLPAAPASGKIVKYYSSSTGIEIPKELWTPPMHSLALESRKSIKGSWKLWSWTILITVAIFALFLFVQIIEKLQKEEQEDFVELRSNLQTNDILHLMCYDDATGMNATLAKVTKISGDTVFIKVSKERIIVESYDFEAAIKKVDKSENVYTSDELAVNYRSLKEGRFVFFKPSNASIISNVNVKNVERN